MDNNITHAAICNGIGGFPLAARWAGIETTWTCEIDPFCNAVSKKNFPDTFQYLDLFDLKNPPYVDIISAGFPCQPFSVAGNQLAQKDDRHLWPQVFRVITEVRPRFVILENVTGIIRLALDEVLADLESEGYTCETFVLPAASINAPHRRDRVWVVAYSRCERQAFGQIATVGADKLCQQRTTSNPDRNGHQLRGFEKNRSKEKESESQQKKRQWLRSNIRRTGEQKPATNTENEMQVRIGEESQHSKSGINGQNELNGNPRSTGCSQFNIPDLAARSGFGNRKLNVRPEFSYWRNFPTQSPLCGRNDGVSERLVRFTDGTISRYKEKTLSNFQRTETIKAYGNSIVPQIAFEIFKAIVLIDKEL